ncbi:MAG TPA: DUF1501 domain-containing protein [Planctomycetota bacterium]|nr:DUF1501 domain-containing protein [Planctomycetota bacterium]
MFDVPMSRKVHAHCDGMARRDFLRLGALGPLGFSLGNFLCAKSAGAAEGKGKAKSVILVYLGGGLSHHDSFDPKPDAPSEVRGKYHPIKTNVPGLRVGELLPMMAETMDKVALIRSGSHNNDHHETATNWVLSGRFGSAFGDYPAMGAVAAHETGFRGALPPYVAIPKNPSFSWELGRSAYLGGKYESFRAGDPNEANYKVRDLGALEPIDAKKAARRKELLGAVDSLGATVKGDDQIGTYDEFHQRAAEMILSPEAQAAFDMEQEKPDLRDRYGRTTFGQSCLLARRLVERGVKFVTVNSGGWDHHAKIWDGLEKKLPEFDRGFSALIQDLARSGLLGETLVACFGEFGRTPKINKDNGRDHWGPVASLLFAGAGVRGGQVIGASDKNGERVTDRPIKPADVSATIFNALGVDPHGWLNAPDGRPIEILNEGDPIPELYV